MNGFMPALRLHHTHSSSVSPTASNDAASSSPTSSQPHQLAAYSPLYATSPNRGSKITKGSSLSSSTAHHGLKYVRSLTSPLLKPPKGKSFSEYLGDWGSQELFTFLDIHKCGQYLAIFQENDINGKILLDLDVTALKSMGIDKISERVRLIGGIKDLRKRIADETIRAPFIQRCYPPERTLLPSLPSHSNVFLDKWDYSSSASRLGKGQIAFRPPPLDLQGHMPPRLLPHASQGIATIDTHDIRTTKPKIEAYIQQNPLGQPQSVPTKRSDSLTLCAPPSRNVRRQSPSSRHFEGRESQTDGFTTLNMASDRQVPSSTMNSVTLGEDCHLQREEGLPLFLKVPQFRNTFASSHKTLIAGRAPLTRGDTISHQPTGPAIAGQDSPVNYRISKTVINTKEASQGDLEHPFAVKSIGSQLGLLVGVSGMAHDPVTDGFKSKGKTSVPLTGTSSSDISAVNANSAALSLADLRRQLVKFINTEDDTIRTVNVMHVTSGEEILERALKKFGKWGTGMHSSPDVYGDEDGDETLEIDGWEVYTERTPDESSKPLSESSLLKTCTFHREGTAIQDKGLFLRKKQRLQKRKNIQHFFGETLPPPMSPTSPTLITGPHLGIVQGKSQLASEPAFSSSNRLSTLTNKGPNRASMISVMSGLGVPIINTLPSPQGNGLCPTGSVHSHKKKSMYNFFGHRPPSELISNHLADYFPSAKKSDVEKARHSLLRLSGDTVAYKKNGIDEGDNAPDHWSKPGNNQPPSLPPFEPSQDTLSDSLQAYASSTPVYLSRPKHNVALRRRRDSDSSSRSHTSVLMQTRRNRDRSDTASLLTVDEITAEVENRRASTIPKGDYIEETEDSSFIEGDTLPEYEESKGLLRTACNDSNSIVDSGKSFQRDSDVDQQQELEDEEEDKLDDEEEEEEEEKEDEDEQGKAFTSTGSKRIIKWIKGALIGAGSFGSVYLGMDAQSGLLMAVKQVELSAGSVKSEDRKRSMLSALEHEIELLKELQHENIVQYLDSSVDTNHLNIFLEYVPGGSVAALLNNYGAFEEGLVRNFVRQILTGLNYLHMRGIVHRDIKGANILVDNKGGIKISDFGISKKVENSLISGLRTNRPSLQGSVFWMAPEVVKQTSYSPKADIWSVGCLVVEMLTGTHPWADLTQMQAIFRIGSLARPAPPSDISVQADEFLRKTFEIEHAKRPTAAQLLKDPFIDSPRVRTTASNFISEAIVSEKMEVQVVEEM
ncbi:mitogen-activated protein kinase kinase kinase [Cryptococcus neoformans Ze90-1]|nr:mitogen-activated protein kinase kinase kinase [Cryptococcus neoformans var. grubii Ze90-1]